MLRGNYDALHEIIWFLPAMFCVKILGALLRRQKEVWTGRSGWIAALVLAGAWIVYFAFTPRIASLHVRGVVPFGIDIAFYLLPFMAVIAGLKNMALSRGKVAAILAIPCVYAGDRLIHGFEVEKLYSGFHMVIDLAQYSVAETVMGYIGMVMLSGGLLWLFMATIPRVLGPNSTLLGLLGALGVYSFPIFLTHYYFMDAGSKVIRDGLARSGWAIDATVLATVLSIGALAMGLIFPILLSKLVMRIAPQFRYAGFVR